MVYEIWGPGQQASFIAPGAILVYALPAKIDELRLLTTGKEVPPVIEDWWRSCSASPPDYGSLLTLDWKLASDAPVFETTGGIDGGGGTYVFQHGQGLCLTG